jgi:MFS family permease
VLFALVVVVLRIVGARWPDRYGAARVSGLALIISTVGLAVTGLAPSAEGLLVGTLIFAAGVAFTMPALVALAVSRVPPTERGAVVGTSTVFMDVAFGIAPVVLGVLANRMGYEPTFVFSAVLAALGGLLLFARRRSLQLEPAPA